MSAKYEIEIKQYDGRWEWDFTYNCLKAARDFKKNWPELTVRIIKVSRKIIK